MTSETTVGQEPHERLDAPTTESSDVAECTLCGARADGLDTRISAAVCSRCANQPIVLADGGIVEERPRLANLSAFQRDILWVLNHNGALKGLAIKSKLQDYYDDEVNHGQLYPNLDQLVEEGYVEKGERDKRTNEYRITADGKQALSRRRTWTEAGEVTDV